jgi:hypothetical protein
MRTREVRLAHHQKGIDRYEECAYQGCCRCSVHRVGRLPGLEAAAQASQSCCDATNEKIDRMFRRSISK